MDASVKICQKALKRVQTAKANNKSQYKKAENGVVMGECHGLRACVKAKRLSQCCNCLELLTPKLQKMPQWVGISNLNDLKGQSN